MKPSINGVVAVSTYRYRVAPAFDFSGKVLLVDSDSNRNGKGKELVLEVEGLSNVEKMEALLRAGVTTLICGGLSDGLHNMLISGGIKVIWGVAGPVEDVLRAYRTDRLGEARFYMPGSGKGR